MKGLTRLIAGGYTVMTAVILAVVLGCYAGTAFDSRKAYPLGQGTMLLLGTVLLLALVLFAQRKRGMRRLGRIGGWLGWGLLFVAQASFSFFAYFLTDWDVKSILESAYAIAGGDTYIEYYYYYLYPNNAVLTLIFAGVMKLFRLFSPGAGLERCVYVLIVVQCAVNTATGMLTARLARRLTGSDAFGRLTACVYAAFIGLSPWVMIPYSDSMGLILPVAILNLYQHAREREGLSWAWPVIGVLTALGYLIKPQTVIVTVAILMMEAMRLIGQRRGFAVRLGCVLLAVALGVGPCFDYVIEQSPIKRNDEFNVGFWHYVMMGLNEETNGSFYLDDLFRSTGVTQQEARTQMQLETIRERIASRDVNGWLSHLMKKTLTNFADGSFAWGIEGVFFWQPIEDKDDVISPFLKDLTNSDDGKNYPYLAAYFQILWLGLLTLSLGAGFAMRGLCGNGARRELMAVLLLTLIGLALFETIFEARARYLYTCAPVYLLAGLSGAWYALGIKRTVKERA